MQELFWIFWFSKTRIIKNDVLLMFNLYVNQAIYLRLESQEKPKDI